MKFFSKLALVLVSIMITPPLFSEEKHEKGHEENHKGAHDDEHSEKRNKTEEDHGKENSNISPEKGIIAFSQFDGFKISKEAERNFGLRYVAYLIKGPVEIPKDAIFFGLEEKNLFRQRNKFFKRIDFKEINRSGKNIKVDSIDLIPGDRIVIAGIGFLRIVEISASGGLDEGHSH